MPVDSISLGMEELDINNAISQSMKQALSVILLFSFFLPQGDSQIRTNGSNLSDSIMDLLTLPDIVNRRCSIYLFDSTNKLMQTLPGKLQEMGL